MDMDILNSIRSDKIYMKGDTGDSISAIQELLNTFGYDIEVNGMYDARTHETVNHFKTHHGLSNDSIIDNDTLLTLKKGPQVYVDYRVRIRRKYLDVREGPGILPRKTTVVTGGMVVKIVEETKDRKFGKMMTGGWISIEPINVQRLD